jgi:hypothetical protein
MVNAFDSVGTGQTNLFDSLPPIQQVPAQNPDVINRTARVAALATGNIDTSNGLDTLLGTLGQATDSARSIIQVAGDAQFREQAAMEQQHQDLQGLLNLNQDPQSPVFGNPGAIAKAVSAVVANTAQQRQESAMEQRAVERIQDLAASGNYTQARLLADNMTKGSADDVIRDYNTKQLILNREIDKAAIEDKDKPWFAHLLDFVVGQIPFKGSTGEIGNVDIPDKLKQWSDFLFAGDRMQREASSLWHMPVDEFGPFVRDHLIPNVDHHSTFLGYKDQSEKLALLTSLGSHTPAAWETNIQNGIDNLGWIPFTKMGQAAITAPFLMIKNGARAEAAALVGKAADAILKEGTDVAAARTGMTKEDVERNMLASAVNPEGPESTVPLSGEANLAFDRGKALAAPLTDILQQPGRLTDQELAAAKDAFVQRMTESLGNDVLDTNVVKENLGDGSILNHVEFTLGKKTGGLYQTAATAQRAATSMGYPEAAIIQDESGGFAFKVQHPLPEAGFATNLEVKAKNAASRYLLNSRVVGDDFLADQVQLSGNTRNKIVSWMRDKYGPALSGLSRGEQGAVEQIWAAGEERGTWFTKSQFNDLVDRAYNRAATDKEWGAYNAMQEVNDIEYFLRNDVMYKENALKGFQTVKIDHPNLNFHGTSLVDRALERVPNERVFDLENGTHFTRANPLTEQQLGRYREQGFMMVSTKEAQTLKDGTTIKNFLIKTKNAEVQPLGRYQLAYRAGGHRFYEGKYFAKQAVIGMQPDTQEKFLKNPATYISGTTKAEVDKWAGRMEAARIAFKQGADKSTLDEILGGDRGLPTADEFVEGMKNGTFQKDTSFVTKYDREMPDEYVKVAQNAIDYRDPEETGFNGWLRTNGRMYYSPKGEVLPDYLGRRAPTLDAFRSINRSIMNVANLSSFSDFKISSIERWVNKYGNFLMNRQAHQSDYSQFAHLELKPDTPYPVRQAALAQRDIIRRNIGWKTEWDREKQQFQRSLIEWIGGDDPESLRNGVARGLQTWFQNNNPVQALRGYAFDAKLGMLNPGQLFVQAGTMAASIALSPKHGFASLVTSPGLRAYLTKAGTENMLDVLAKRGVHEMAGFATEADYKAFMRSAKNSGFFDFKGSHGLINDFGPDVALEGVKKAEVQIREAGRFFFNEAEVWNRMTAWHIGWKETAEQFPQLAKDSEEFARRLAGRAEDYSFRMSQQSQAFWQKGLLSIPTQFWAYNARMLEAMVGPGFTGPQKLRLILSQFLLYGSAGLPVLPFISEKIKSANGDPTKFGLDTAAGAVDRGLLDEVMNHVMGSDIDYGKRYGSGAWVTDSVANIFGWGAYGEKTTADMFGGATYAILGNFGKGLLDTARYVALESGDDTKPLVRDALVRVASNVSTFSNALKAYMVTQYHTYETANGATISRDMPDSNAFGVMLGFQPQAQEDVGMMMTHLKDRAKAVNDAASYISTLRARWINEPDKQATIQEEVNTAVRLLPPQLRSEVLRKVNREMKPSMIESLSQRIQREGQQEEVIREFQNDEH